MLVCRTLTPLSPVYQLGVTNSDLHGVGRYVGTNCTAYPVYQGWASETPSYNEWGSYVGTNCSVYPVYQVAATNSDLQGVGLGCGH